MNRVEYNKGVGIRISGTNNKAMANQLVRNGVGMTITGSGALVANNTFDGYDADMEDPFSLWYDPGNVSIVNNIFTNQKSAWLIMQQRSGNSFVPVDPSQVHQNGADLAGNVGATIIAPTSAWYVDVASGDYALSATSPARGAGVNAGVEVDLTHVPYPSPPDLGAYSSGGAVPPIPPQPPTNVTLSCSGTLQSVPGPVQMTCVQQQEGQR